MPEHHRQTPLILVASARPGAADALAGRLRQQGATVMAAHSAAGCLRVATAVGPDQLVLGADLPSRLRHLLRAHPVSASAQVTSFEDWATQPAFRSRPTVVARAA